MLYLKKSLSFLYFLSCVSILFPYQNPTSIKRQIEKISNSIKPGYLGVCALHIEKNQRIEFNEKLEFPMASTYKLPIAIYCLSLVDNGELSLQNKITVTPQDIRRFCFIKPHQKVSIAKLIQLMIEKSDNATSDMVLKMIGGGNVVTEWLKDHGIYQMRIDRTTLKMIADFSGVTNLGDENLCTVEQDYQLLNSVSKKKRTTALKKFYEDKQDTTTPRAMVNLLEKLYKEKLISSESTQFLLQSMLKCKCGKKRISKVLPKKTKFWHKTGTLNKIISDVGIIELPKNKGHLAIAIFTNKSKGSLVKEQHAIANISKLLFDYFSKMK